MSTLFDRKRVETPAAQKREKEKIRRSDPFERRGPRAPPHLRLRREPDQPQDLHHGGQDRHVPRRHHQDQQGLPRRRRQGRRAGGTRRRQGRARRRRRWTWRKRRARGVARKGDIQGKVRTGKTLDIDRRLSATFSAPSSCF